MGFLAFDRTSRSEFPDKRRRQAGERGAKNGFSAHLPGAASEGDD